MAVIMEIKNLSSLINKLNMLQAKYSQASKGSVVVGYTAQYAIYVHENMNPVNLPGALPVHKTGANVKNLGRLTKAQAEAGGAKKRASGLGYYWGPSFYGPKFLEGPARALANDGTLTRIVTTAVKAGATVLQALLLAGQRVQRDSQLAVPVEYGFLKASAFTRLVPDRTSTQ